MAQSQHLTRHSRGRAVPPKRSRLPLLLVSLTLVGLVVGAIIVAIAAQSTTPTVTPFTARTINAPTGTTPEGFAYKGNPDAPVTVIEYGDFQCPSCAAYTTRQEAGVDKAYVETGKVRFIYHDFPLPQHNHAMIVAAAARAAGEQGKFWEMHDLLFTRQRAWSASRNIRPLLSSYAEAIGLDRERFDQALDSGKFTSLLEAAQRQAQERGVQATPTFEVNGQLVSAGELEAAIEAALQAQGK